MNGRWFLRLRIESPVLQALSEQRGWDAGVGRILLLSAPTRGLEGAELFVAGPDERSVVISIRPETLVEPEAALLFLRRELMHIADMLDPTFGYEPSLPPHPAGPAHDRLLLDRYRVLWNCTVDGRIARQGALGDQGRSDRLSEFAAAFPCLRPRTAECFGRLFDATRPRHAELVAIAKDPEVAFGLTALSREQAHRCPLCSFPTTTLEPELEALPEEVLRAIRSDFPAWNSMKGLCRQCADLYRSRSLSLEAAALLPRVH